MQHHTEASPKPSKFTSLINVYLRFFSSQIQFCILAVYSTEPVIVQEEKKHEELTKHNVFVLFYG